MFTFTDTYGNPVPEYTVQNLAQSQSLTGSDITHLPLWIAAARQAQEDGYCSVYDNISEAIGGPTRDDLASMGVLDSTFTVEGTRTLTVTIRVPFSSEYSAARPADVRNNFTVDELGDIDIYEMRDAINNYNYTVDEDEIEIDSVDRN